MTAWARVGAKVVCVDNTDHPEIEVGSIYTISGFVSPPKFAVGKYPYTRLCVRIYEAKNPLGEKGSFAIERFRPLINKTQEQDIAMFKSLLTDTPINETVN